MKCVNVNHDKNFLKKEEHNEIQDMTLSTQDNVNANKITTTKC